MSWAAGWWAELAVHLPQEDAGVLTCCCILLSSQLLGKEEGLFGGLMGVGACGVLFCGLQPIWLEARRSLD